MARDAAAPDGTVSVMFVRVIVEALEHAGFARHALLASAGLDAALLGDLAARLTLAQFADLRARALDMTGDHALGLHVAERMTEGAYELVAHMAQHAPTLRDAVALFGPFSRLLMDGSSLELDESKDWAILRCDFPRAEPRVDRMFAEMSQVGLLRMIGGFARQSAPRAVFFDHARPAHHAEYARIFGDAVRFSHGIVGIEFARHILDRPHIHAHAELFAVLRAEAERSLARLTEAQGFSHRVRLHLLAQSQSSAPLPDMDAAARELGLSARSLRRRLAEEGTSFKALVESVLAFSAERMLRDPNRSIKETAHALGFSDAAAFQRAFKRWKGVTPGRFRGTGEA